MKAFNPLSPTFFTLFTHLLLCQAICYYPSGDVAPQDLPCNDEAGQAACCGPAYVCLSNGICMSSGLEKQLPNQALYVRGSCTDKDWRSSKCPSFCVDPAKGHKLDGGIGIKKCPNRSDDTYHCDDGQPFDCDLLDNVLSFQGTPTVMTTIGVARSTTQLSTTTTTTTTSSLSSATTTLSSSTTPSPTPNSKPTSDPSNSVTANVAPAESSSSPGSSPQPSDSQPSNGLIIGLAVAVPSGVLGLAAAGLTFFWSRRKLKRAANARTQGTTTTNNSGMEQAPAKMDGPPVPGYINGYNMYHHHYKPPEPGLAVAEAWVPPTELPGGTGVNPVAWELPGGNRY
ncbi:uncharacterized protein B0T15DRAFT_522099 [Chaetomium strumarium]|uniref:Mid2 domain-containing protein n=1 Tax=Chaetomium strumarium TaxID=1170767 RepID=A0AAJ0M785_9PEZI|nr:hypothetical protein B0T15DRAFT_522099 [Chaetomium strumarium]